MPEFCQNLYYPPLSNLNLTSVSLQLLGLLHHKCFQENAGHREPWRGTEHGLNGFLFGSVVRNLPANVGDSGNTDLIPGSGRSLREGNGNPLWYSVDGRAWQTTTK